jgi:hypothetical protein
LLSDNEDNITSLSALRQHLLEFALDGYFPEVCSREVIHEYYGMTKRGLGVQSAFESANSAISDIDAQFTLDRQVKLAEDMGENVAATRSPRGKATVGRD